MSTNESEEQIWDKLYDEEEKQIASGLEEHSWTEGEDGELEFDRRVLAASKDKDVIDIGCGPGEFTIQIASRARRVAGVDFSKRALKKALEHIQSAKLPNIEFKLALADKLPYSHESFDLAISRRGPATDTRASIAEAYRVLRREGRLMVQDIGERDKQNWTQVFGRGQMLGTAEFSVEVKKKLANVGFKDIRTDEFEVNEYFAGVQDVLMRLENSPIVPRFNREFDQGYVEEIVKRYTTPKGILTNSHRVLVSATK